MRNTQMEAEKMNEVRNILVGFEFWGEGLAAVLL